MFVPFVDRTSRARFVIVRYRSNALLSDRIDSRRRLERDAAHSFVRGVRDSIRNEGPRFPAVRQPSLPSFEINRTKPGRAIRGKTCCSSSKREDLVTLVTLVTLAKSDRDARLAAINARLERVSTRRFDTRANRQKYLNRKPTRTPE